MIKLFKNVLALFGLRITKNFKLYFIFRKNIFRKKYKKRVLISYISFPFNNNNYFFHTNVMECYTASEIFNNLGFSVDIIDCFSDKKINYSKYDIIYGMGKPLEKSFYFKNKKIKRIFYATGSNPAYSNIKTIIRARDFYNHHGELLLQSTRTVNDFYLQTFFSDRVIILGNNNVLNTYKNFEECELNKLFNINAFFYDVYDIDIYKKDILSAKKHFLWFGSAGAIHKGLDILIDIFSKRDDIYLHICGLSKKENGFINYYSKILSSSKNIINHGFVDIKSEDFKKIMNDCFFVLFPSASEGGAAAILNVIANGGLVPIITESTGLDVDDFGVLIKKPKIKDTLEAIERVMFLDDKQILSMAIEAKSNIRNNYTYSKYKDNLTKLIKDII